MKIIHRRKNKEVAELSYDSQRQELRVEEFEPMVATIIFMALQTASMIESRIKQPNPSVPEQFTISPVSPTELEMIKGDLLSDELVIAE